MRGCAINRRHLALFVSLWLLALAACQRAEIVPTTVPTIAATPRSTALPTPEGIIPPGSADNPIQIVLAAANAEGASEAASIIEAALKERSGVEVRVMLVERPADALAALCASPGGTAAAAWLDGLTAAAAIAQNCGAPSLMLERATVDGSRAHETIQVITAVGSNVRQISSLADSTFCRLDVMDRNTWLLPAILLQANGIDPVRRLDAVIDYESVDAMLDAVIDGECDGAGAAASSLDTADEATRDGLRVIASMDVAYSLLLYPLEINLSQRGWLNEAFSAIAADSEAATALRVLIGQDSLRPSTPDDLTSLADALDAAEIDLAAYGRP
jgi:ABC-type phosphate/phosphonate transport system substrate-binding protein